MTDRPRAGASPGASDDIPDAGFPSEGDIAAIVAVPDAVRRNRWITWSYHRLDRALMAVTGDADLSWCGFATAASGTAGEFIREEEVPRIVADWVAGTLAGANLLERLGLLALDYLGLPLHDLAAQVLREVMTAIAEGNRVVFREIAPPFARLLAQLDGRPRLPPDERAAFLATIVTEGGAPLTDALRTAFTALLDGTEAPDAEARAECVLHSNAWVAWVEQRHVQPYIRRSMNAPIAALFHEKLEAHVRFFVSVARAATMPWPIRRLVLAPLARALERSFRQLATRTFLRLDVPGGSFDLSSDVPPLASGAPWPTALTEIRSAPLLALLTRLQALDPRGSGACDWCDFHQRMRFIGVLLRSRQQEATLRGAPDRPPPPVPTATQ